MSTWYAAIRLGMRTCPGAHCTVHPWPWPWPLTSELKIGTSLIPALGNIHVNFGFLRPFCFQVKSPYSTNTPTMQPTRWLRNAGETELRVYFSLKVEDCVQIDKLLFTKPISELYRASTAIWDHTVLPGTQNRWVCPSWKMACYVRGVIGVSWLLI